MFKILIIGSTFVALNGISVNTQLIAKKRQMIGSTANSFLLRHTTFNKYCIYETTIPQSFITIILTLCQKDTKKKQYKY